MEEKKVMRVNPVNGSQPSFMRFNKSEEMSQPETNNQNNANPGFKKVMKDLECQPIKPTFKGHWSMYNSFPIEVEKPVINDPYPTKPRPNGTLNFIV